MHGDHDVTASAALRGVDGDNGDDNNDSLPLDQTKNQDPVCCRVTPFFFFFLFFVVE